MSTEARLFYDDLAPDYDLIYADWDGAVEGQAAALHRIIQQSQDRELPAILDCTCGIGTQILGLAMYGYPVHGSDISAKSIERARTNATRLGIGDARFTVADMTRPPESGDDVYGVVMTTDNSLAHLLTEEDLRAALDGIRSRLMPEGLFIASLRDYDRVLQERPEGTPVRALEDEAGRRLVFQVWDWHDAEGRYDLNHFICREVDGEWSLRHRRTTCRAWTSAELTAALEERGFSEVRWSAPAESGFFQPIVTARKG